jgi:hypothetical protein
MAALRYHGMLHGLRVILSASPTSPRASVPCAPMVAPVVEQRELVRLLANMVLETQSETMHVY